MVVTLLVMLAFQLIPWLAAIPYCGAAALSRLKIFAFAVRPHPFSRSKWPINSSPVVMELFKIFRYRGCFIINRVGFNNLKGIIDRVIIDAKGSGHVMPGFTIIQFQVCNAFRS